MRVLRKCALVSVLLMLATTTSILASGPLQKRVEFTINVPYMLESGGLVLPPGDYVLHQVSQNNLNLFALYEGDMTDDPIAMVQTVRIDFQSGDYPEEAEVMLTIDEEQEGCEDLPALTSWTIPGMDGWEVIGVVD